MSQAESRLQLEQANGAHLERAQQALAQRDERLEAELETLAEPEAAALQSVGATIAELEQGLGAAQRRCESLQAEHAAAEEPRAQAAEALGAAQREHAAAHAQLDTLRQIQAAAEDNAPLQEWLERHGLAQAARLWQKLRIDHGWETAVEAVLRERLHALELTDSSRLASALADRPPVKASVFAHGGRSRGADAAGLPLTAKIHVSDPAVAGALADWLAGVVAVEGIPDARMREALPERRGPGEPGRPSVHPPYRELPCARPGGCRPACAPGRDRGAGQALRRAWRAPVGGGGRSREHDEQAALRSQALEQARQEITARQKALHDAQIENVKLSQAHERYRERSAQVRAELEEVRAESERTRQALGGSSELAGRVAGEIQELKSQAEAARQALAEADGALATQRAAVQQAERDAQDALFGERECNSKIAEIDNAVRVIDQQIERADVEVVRLNEELAPTRSLRCARRWKRQWN